ncbi:hypothetical protein ABZT02_40650 [Streptomyces sp. NPDC005402]|uniref:hypothetical protein n=1 Tax=Streptomyces sp. NPDC005402 TaxID=3155338 RepID=UPI0033B69E73
MDKWDPTAVLPWELGEPAQVPPLSGGSMEWRPPRGETPAGSLVAGADRAGFTMRRFARWLREAEVLDQGPIDLAGASVMLPHGMRMMRRFDAIVRRAYELRGYEEYDYPLLVPDSVLEPSRGVISLDKALIFAGDDIDWAEGRKRMVLTPTGEGAVYTHWARLVRTRRDLPIRTYRHTKYFRPTRSGRSVFRAIEASDIYEFQACFADRVSAAEGFAVGLAMAREVCAAVHVPVLWGTRPPWTNNTGVAEATVGGDVPLPTGSTLQVSSVYRQGQRFSRLYGVGYREGGQLHHTHHVTGALSRRLVLVHLLLGMDADGALVVHPDLAPTEVALTLAGGDPAERTAAEALAARLISGGVRCELVITADRKEVGRLHRRWHRQGVPIRVYLQPRRTVNERTRAVVVRADTREEAVLLTDDLAPLAELLPTAVKEVGVGYLARTRGFVRGQCQPVDKGTIREVLTERAVAVAPLSATREAVEAVASWGLGEVLSLRRAEEPSPCVITGEPTYTVAYVSPRM